MTNLTRAYRGRYHHIVTEDGAATLCGKPISDMIAVWPISLNNRVAPAPMCPKCRTAAHP